ncbi:hypothetical protein C8Q78DRAFT_134229 [Trametes maxima]|nr:hypothetical protein C8Q78DRAFT_134229 [Trametes maxima]
MPYVRLYGFLTTFAAGISPARGSGSSAGRAPSPRLSSNRRHGTTLGWDRAPLGAEIRKKPRRNLTVGGIIASVPASNPPLFLYSSPPPRSSRPHTVTPPRGPATRMPKESACRNCASKKVGCKPCPGHGRCVRCMEYDLDCERPVVTARVPSTRKTACEECRSRRIRCERAEYPSGACYECMVNDRECVFKNGTASSPAAESVASTTPPPSFAATATLGEGVAGPSTPGPSSDGYPGSPEASSNGPQTELVVDTTMAATQQDSRAGGSENGSTAPASPNRDF